MKHDDKKSVLITGCSSGIGIALAKGLKENGFRVIASCRSEIDRSTLAELGFDAVILDLSDSASIAKGVAETLIRLCNPTSVTSV